MSAEIGSTVSGIVVRVLDRGAIVRLTDGAVGLVHISEIAQTYVGDVREHLKENDRIRVRVLGKDGKGRYLLSAKQADSSPGDQQVRRGVATNGFQAGFDWQPHPARPPATFEERLARFMRESEERLLDLRRNIESKRGGSARR